MSFTMAEIQIMADTVDVSLSAADTETVEMATSGQATNKNWFTYSGGRITASVF